MGKKYQLTTNRKFGSGFRTELLSLSGDVNIVCKKKLISLNLVLRTTDVCVCMMDV
jgi:hypothetical protein